ncbi:sterol desaturase family protein [Fibrella forsythiae]|uniref:Sterol desaturase family protein n=1 Tax=Fibrella forsythiae TaxID=2817061 RepID=A0ABS3JAK3_9BACT|nr:sterol desaturase family protein [Fibrella forsythiae]MBO0947028.1 sterol desaturase family protein [Fibrella forsythiae]
MNDLVNYSIPAFVILIAAEVAITAWQQRDHYETKDSASSITMGIGSVIVGFVGKALALGAYSLVYQFRLFTIDMSQVWPWVALFFAEDFSYYWFHRISHGSRWFWASHVVHHSSQKYNLSTAVRQTWTGTITGSFIFWLWLPLIGFSPLSIMTMQSISLLYQFWIHTELIRRLPRPIEWLFNTPSHHRVHHGSDLAYLDKNHAGVLIIWDRLFGTFEPEQHRPTYGLTKNVGSYNPIRIAFHEWGDIANDVRHASSFRHALGYLFGPPGWSHDGSRKTTKELRVKK